jgi:hypothetical protein
MKQKIYFIVCVLFLGVSYSFGQHYVNVYEHANEDVRFKMDANKIQGIDILNGVKATHTVGISGLTAAQKTQFETLLSNNSQIFQYTLSADLKSLVLETQANVYRLQVEEILNNFNLMLTGHTVTYSIND